MNLNKTFSKHHFFFKNILGLKWITLLYSMLLIYQYPIAYITQKSSLMNQQGFARLSHYSSDSSLTIIVCLIPIVIGILSFGYLNSTKQTTHVHSLPITRKKIFIEQYSSGIVAILIPHIITLLVLLLTVFLMPKELLAYETITWFSISIFFSVTFYAVSVFSCMMIGTPIAQGVFTLIIFVLPFGLISLVSSHLNILVKGFYNSYPVATFFISPLTGYINLFQYSYMSYSVPGWFWVLTGVYLVLFTALAYILYKRFKVENFENAVHFTVFLPYLKWIGVFCSMLLTGKIAEDITGLNVFVPIGNLIGIIIGYIVLEMIIQKTLTLKVSFKELSLMIVIFGVLFNVTAFDLFNYGDKTIDLNKTQSVYFSKYPHVDLKHQMDKMLTSDESIEAVYELYKKSQEISPDYFWQQSTNYEDFLFSFVDENNNYVSRTFKVNDEELHNELIGLYETKEYLMSTQPFLEVHSSDVLYLTLRTPLGDTIITEKDTIKQLMLLVQEDIINNAEALVNSNLVHISDISVTVPRTSSSNPYNSNDKDLEETVRINCNLLNQYKLSLAYINNQEDLSHIMPKASLVKKIMLKPLKDDQSVDTYGNYSGLYEINPTDSDVIVITSKSEIKSLLESPIYNVTSSENDYRMTVVFEDSRSSSLLGFVTLEIN